MNASGEPAARALRDIADLLRARRWPEALAACRQVNLAHPRLAAGWHATAQCLLALGSHRAALEAAAQAQAAAGADPALLDALGTLYSRAGEQRRALAAYDAAIALAPDAPHFLFNRAAVRRFLGDFAAAEEDYDRVIQLRPGDYEAYKNRADLRTQSAERNHIAQLEALAARPFAQWRGEVQIRYALAKEHEDLGNHERSFEHLAHGARLRRAHLQYDLSHDLATVDWIIEAFAQGPAEAPAAASGESPIFIVGLPRSGTTLVERILASHSRVVSAGELPHFALGIVEAVRAGGGAPPSRRELVARSARIDFAALGRQYLRRARAGLPDGPRFIDKMPLNYLYCGLIARALPQARIVHLVRHPMAACYAMFKTLFDEGYPFSYDLTELGSYYLGYARLMAHWLATLPGRIHPLSYESLVADQRLETRRLLEFCGLDWEEGCVEFHRNRQASTTASAAQVRQPIYQSSVAQWRCYRRQLASLERQLTAAGLVL